MKKERNAGDTLGIVSLIFGIIAFVFGIIALVPLLGLVIAIITGIFALVAVGTGIPGVIKAAGKGKCIVGLVFGGLSLIWAFVRIFWMAGFFAISAVG